MKMKSKFHQIDLNLILFLMTCFFSEATETRHALHGVTWPSSNPKCLHVDFGKQEDMEKAILSTMEHTIRIQFGTENQNAKQEKEFGWIKNPNKTVTEDRSRVSIFLTESWTYILQFHS